MSGASRPAAPTLDAHFHDLRTRIDAALDRGLASLGSPPVLDRALRYSLLGAGKRLRPCLTLSVASAVAARTRVDEARAMLLALPAACAVEMIHAYSLVHDDLPAMDDDDLRRGRPTTHVIHGDGLAILAGDGLLTAAFAVLAASPSPVLPPDSPEPPESLRLRTIARLAEAGGAAGMVGGQAIDLAAAGKVRDHAAGAFDRDSLADMHSRKTGALIRAAATMGAIAVGADAALETRVDNYARELGLAFQIVDDVLDVEGSNEALGKTAGKDAASGKPTYPALYGLDVSRRLARECVERAIAEVRAAGLEGWLATIAEWSLQRRR
jgi:geranylgeranyl pyrophosphate synthase